MLVVTALCCLADSANAAVYRGTILEIKGSFAKVERHENAKIQKGDQGKHLGESLTPVTVTAVGDDYIVVKLETTAKVGDVIEIGRARISVVLPTSKPKPKMPEPDSAPKIEEEPKLPPAEAKPIRKSREELQQEKIRAAQEAEQERWEALLKRTGQRTWKKPTEAEHAAMIAKHKEVVEKALKTYPQMRLYETSNFLFCSNIPPNQVAIFVRQLDTMHAKMLEMYGIPKGEKVFLGKALVLAFLTKESFHHFEKAQFDNAPGANVYGRCHSSSSGSVLVACYRGEDAYDFGQMLVHETSHGFLHRYRTPATVPAWVNEGMAEVIGKMVVPQSMAVNRKQEIELKQAATFRSLGGALSGKLSGGPFDHYGIASAVVGFLVQTDSRKFRRFINNLKGGMEYREALLDSYGITPEQLAFVFGRSKGIQGMMP